MRPQYSITQGPAAEPVTYDEAAEHLRVDSADDVAYINGLVSVAREYVDSVTNRSSTQTTWKITAPSWESLFTDTAGSLDCFDPLKGLVVGQLYVIPLQRSPLISVTSVKYYAPDAASLTTMDTADYRVITAAEPGIVQIKESPPSVDDRADAIEIEFVAGSNVPGPMHRHAVKLLVAQLYENRMPVAFASCKEIPFTLDTLLTAQRVGGWF